jgi:hypothetical protein
MIRSLSEVTGTGKLNYTQREAPAITGLSNVVQTFTDLVSWPSDPAAVQTVTRTIGVVQSMKVILITALPLTHSLTAPAIFVRVKAAP